MLTALVSAALVAAAVAVGLAALGAVTVLPFLWTLSTAERGGLTTGRWAGLSLVAVTLAVGSALTLARVGAGPLPVLLPLGLAFLPVAAARVLAGDERWGGRAGRHESPV